MKGDRADTLAQEIIFRQFEGNDPEGDIAQALAADIADTFRAYAAARAAEMQERIRLAEEGWSEFDQRIEGAARDERAGIVAWLRQLWATDDMKIHISKLADAIERGDHRKHIRRRPQDSLRNYAFASEIITAAMGGRDKVNADPLAYWCGIFTITDVIEPALANPGPEG